MGQLQGGVAASAHRGPSARVARRQRHAGAVADRDPDPEFADGAVGVGAVRRSERHAAGRPADLPPDVLRGRRSHARRRPGARAARSPERGGATHPAAAGAGVHGATVRGTAHAAVRVHDEPGRAPALRPRDRVPARARPLRVSRQSATAAADQLPSPDGLVDARAGREPAARGATTAAHARRRPARRDGRRGRVRSRPRGGVRAPGRGRRGCRRRRAARGRAHRRGARARGVVRGARAQLVLRQQGARVAAGGEPGRATRARARAAASW